MLHIYLVSGQEDVSLGFIAAFDKNIALDCNLLFASHQSHGTVLLHASDHFKPQNMKALTPVYRTSKYS